MALSVIGAGLGRTGTMSLKLALEQLGFGPCYHMVEVLKEPAVRSRAWEDAADGKPVDWNEVFAGFNSCVDWPGATFYRQLADTNPEAKIILTTRDPEEWFASTQATIFSRHIPEDTDDPWARMVLKVIGDMFDRQMTNKSKLIEVYDRHNQAVRQTIAPDRLLDYQLSQGWTPLCEFLGVPVPATPMPKANTTQEFQDRLASTLVRHTQ